MEPMLSTNTRANDILIFRNLQMLFLIIVWSTALKSVPLEHLAVKCSACW
jgi:hypothetical protein